MRKTTGQGNIKRDTGIRKNTGLKNIGNKSFGVHSHREVSTEVEN